MKLSLDDLNQALNWRAAIKKYDKTKSVSEGAAKLNFRGRADGAIFCWLGAVEVYYC
jgi:hypothetical protein